MLVDGLFHIPIISECYQEICELLGREVPWEFTEDEGRINVIVPWYEAKKVDKWLAEL